MKRLLLISFLAVLFNLVIVACDEKKEEDKNPGVGSVDLYLLKSYKTIGSTCQIDESTAVTNESPLVAFSELLSYNSATYTFRVSDAARASIMNLDHSVHGVAFAIKANDTLVYAGYFWPGYSSLSCNWVVIDPLSLYASNDLRVTIGYPGPGEEIPDKRNDKRILDIFADNNKLIN
jgi:hypothetical protein